MANNNQIIWGVIFITLILLLMVAGIAVSFYIATRQRMQKDLKLREAALDYEKELRAAESAVSEMVLAHIGRELHDNVGHILTRLRLQIESKMLDDVHNEQMLAPMQQTLIAASDQLRLLSRTLNPDFLNSNDLLTSIRVEVDRIRLLRVAAVHFMPDETMRPALNKEQQLLAFRIFQEAVSNIIKHAAAKNIFITLNDEDGFYLSIKDDGKGFERKEEKENGIKNMIKRAELAQLNFQLITLPGKGCNIILQHNDE